MQRWSLGNCFQNIKFNQFQSLSNEFKSACEDSFGTSATVLLKLMSQPKAFTTFWDDDEHKRLTKINDNNTIATFDDINNISESDWKSAAYVEMTVKPTDEDKAPSSAFGHLEFKGGQPKTSTYYLQGGDSTEKTKQQFISDHKNMVVGDGFNSHGRQSGMAYMRVASKLGTPSKIISAVLEKGNFSLKL